MTKKELQERFIYDNGELRFKYSPSNRVKKDSIAGSTQLTGYKAVNIGKVKYFNHRLIWIYFHGDIPENMVIDHIDRNKLNNRISNLRLVTVQQNNWNTKAKGYVFTDNRYKARITISTKQYTLGSYLTSEEATEAFKSAKELLPLFTNDKLTNIKIQKMLDTVRPDTQLNNTSGYRGVHQKSNGKYQARVTTNNKRISLGYFNTAEDANNAITQYKGK